MKTALIRGVSGQDGALSRQIAARKGLPCDGTSRDAQVANFVNLDRLSITDHVELESMVLTDFRSALQTITKVKPEEVYNLAGQSSVALSFQQLSKPWIASALVRLIC
jgi:GDPmannose 4,6-dehydratase